MSPLGRNSWECLVTLQVHVLGVDIHSQHGYSDRNKTALQIEMPEYVDIFNTVKWIRLASETAIHICSGHSATDLKESFLGKTNKGKITVTNRYCKDRNKSPQEEHGGTKVTIIV